MKQTAKKLYKIFPRNNWNKVAANDKKPIKNDNTEEDELDKI